jgi:hypothetical protein
MKAGVSILLFSKKEKKTVVFIFFSKNKEAKPNERVG